MYFALIINNPQVYLIESSDIDGTLSFAPIVRNSQLYLIEQRALRRQNTSLGETVTYTLIALRHKRRIYYQT